MVGSPAPWARIGWAGGQGLALAIPDVTPPTVVSFSPADNATGVSPSTDLVATMSEVVILGAAGVISLKKTSDNSVIQTWNVATQGGTGAGQVSVVGGAGLTMRLTSALSDTTEYYVIWDAGVVKDTSNNNVAALSVTTTWSFTTGTAVDVTAPTVTAFSPLDNATGVAVSTNLVATMSETVVLGASGVITLKRTSDNATIDSWNVATAGGSTAGKVEVVAGTALTMHLTTSLANSIEYYVIWDAGVVVDLASNPIAANAVTTLWSFTTAASAGAGTVIQWMLAPGVEVNAETTSRQWMAAPGVYGNVAPLTGAAFSGLLDLYSTASMAYSFRKLRNAYAGSAVRIRRSSDNLELNVGFDGNGDFDSAAAATHIGGGSGFIVTWFDQSGNGIDVTQATAATQPVYNATGMNSKPSATLAASTHYWEGTSITNAAVPASSTTIMSVLTTASVTTGTVFGWRTTAPLIQHLFSSSSIFFDFGDFGATTGRLTVAAPGGFTTGGHLLEVGRDLSASQFITADGIELARAARAAVPTGGSGTLAVGAQSAGGTPLNGSLSELVIWAADLAANRSAARANVQSYWIPAATLLLDVLGVSATRAYSTRKLRSAYAGSAIRIRRSSDNAEQDIGFVGENLDTAAITAFVGANSAFVVKMYDQSGTADDCVQATAANQPRMVNAGTLDVRNTKAAPLFNGTSHRLTSTASVTVAEASALVATTQAGPTWGNYFGAVDGSQVSTATGQSGIAGHNGASTYQTGTIAADFAFQAGSVNNGANTPVFNNVLQQVRMDGSGATWTFAQIGDMRSQGLFWSGWIGEAVVFSTALSAGNRTAMYTNQKTYWGTP